MAEGDGFRLPKQYQLPLLEIGMSPVAQAGVPSPTKEGGHLFEHLN